MHKSALDLLIEEYEIEEQNLQLELDGCHSDCDYKRADYFSKALWRVQDKLRLLQNFKNPFYQRIEDLKNRVAYYRSLKTKEPFTKLDTSFQNEIEDCEKEIRELKEKKTTINPETQEFDDAVFDLIEGKIKGFTLHLIKKDNLYIDFRLTEKKTLLISFTPLNNITNEYYDVDRIWKQLKLIGFTFNPESDSFQYSYNLATFKNSIFLKELTSRIVFDAFYLKDLDDPACIELR